MVYEGESTRFGGASEHVSTRTQQSQGKNCRASNNISRRPKQHQDMVLRIIPIPLAGTTLVMLTDAAFQNAQGGASQAKYLIAVITDQIVDGQMAPLIPLAW